MAGEKAPALPDRTTDIATLNAIPQGSDRETSLRSQDYAQAMLRLEVATYISQMSAELSVMAKNSDMALLSYFLDMAAAEARATDQLMRETLKLGADPDTTSAIAQA